MADSATGRVDWYSPDPRALLPLDERFHISRSLQRLVRREHFTVTRDQAFPDVIRQCAEPREDRPDTWISEDIIAAYVELFEEGYGHSVECWLGDDLVGGLYGVAIGGVFFGESMFTRERDASKVALVHLVEHLRARRFELLEIQFMTPHLARFGAFEVPRETYLQQLASAVNRPIEW